jgi:hypothetical protein
MNVEIGTETPIFLFWEYLFQNFGILSLQCRLQPYAGVNYCTLYPTVRENEFGYWRMETPWAGDFRRRWSGGETQQARGFWRCYWLESGDAMDWR